MAIEGPLRELGIHDVFQLLDLSRKTGILRVSSELREDEGLVYFDGGRVIQATIRSKTLPLESALLHSGRITQADLERARGQQSNGHAGRELVELLVEIGAITQRELERQLRLQLESVVFELMSWREGFFSFEERSRNEMPGERRITVSTESLLMEGARRIDEWSRIADVVPNVAMIPELAPVESGRDGGGAMLDLLPHEWQVLTMIDGERDLRGIAVTLARDEFEVAKIAYGLTTTGIITVRAPARRTPDPDQSALQMRFAAARAHTRAGRYTEAVDELRHAMQEDPLTPAVHLEFAYACARAGDFPAARASWEHFLSVSSRDAVAADVHRALNALNELQQLLEAQANG